MSFQRQFHEDLAREYAFLGNEDYPKKKNTIESKTPPAPKIMSKSSQIEKLKNMVDQDSQQKKVNEFKKQALKAHRLMGAEIDDSDSRSSKNTLDFQKEQKKTSKQSFLRQEFPFHLLREYPFLNSPTMSKEKPGLLRLIDNRICKQETREVLDRLTRGL